MVRWFAALVNAPEGPQRLGGVISPALQHSNLSVFFELRLSVAANWQ